MHTNVVLPLNSRGRMRQILVALFVVPFWSYGYFLIRVLLPLRTVFIPRHHFK